MAPEFAAGRPRRVHVIGVGGAGMSGIAEVLVDLGHEVSGSDLRESPVTERLRRRGVTVYLGHHPNHAQGAEIVTASPAVRETNPELRGAIEAGAVFMARAEVLAELVALKATIAIAGTHGKTSTTSRLALALTDAGLAPGYLIGAEVGTSGSNARWGRGDLLVLEADESYGTFALMAPQVLGITNIEADHLDHYGDLGALERGFEALLERTTGSVVVYGASSTAGRIGRRHGATIVGPEFDCDLVVGDVVLERAASSFTLTGAGLDRLELKVASPGMHSVANAAIAASTALAAGVEPGAIAAGLQRFTGVPRRFEFRGTAAGVTFVDDYGHLPSEVDAVLEAAAAGGWQRIVAVFQPHRYTRIAKLFEDFATAFDRAQLVVVTDIYAAGEDPIPGVSGRLVADAIGAGGSVPVRYVERRDHLVAEVAEVLEPGDLCLIFSAGDLTTLSDQLRLALEP